MALRDEDIPAKDGRFALNADESRAEVEDQVVPSSLSHRAVHIYAKLRRGVRNRRLRYRTPPRWTEHGNSVVVPSDNTPERRRFKP